MNERQLYALTTPVDGADPAAVARLGSVTLAGDGARLAVVLAVDR